MKGLLIVLLVLVLIAALVCLVTFLIMLLVQAIRGRNKKVGIIGAACSVGAIILVIILMNVIQPAQYSAINNTNTKSSQIKYTPEGQTPAPLVMPEDVPQNNLINKGSIGKYDIRYWESFLTTDVMGDNIIVIAYEFTNNSVNEECSGNVLTQIAFQDGIQMKYSSVLDNRDYDLNSAYTLIKPGKTLIVYEGYLIKDITLPIEYEITSNAIHNNDKIIFKIEPSKIETR